ncbi:hypothetical protein ACWDQ0_01140 [Streptomyces sp. NPDC003642]
MTREDKSENTLIVILLSITGFLFLAWLATLTISQVNESGDMNRMVNGTGALFGLTLAVTLTVLASDRKSHIRKSGF